MTDTDFAALVSDIQTLRACFVVDASSGALHREYRRNGTPRDPALVARAVAGLARAQTDLVGLAEPAKTCTLEWPDALVIVRAASHAALVAFFFDPRVTLGAARMHVGVVVTRLEGELPGGARSTIRTLPTVPAAQASPAQRLLAHLSEQVPDVHAALLRVSLQTGLPLSRLETPQTLSPEEFERVTASVRRILGADALPP